jgi:hypothetical protein
MAKDAMKDKDKDTIDNGINDEGTAGLPEVFEDVFDGDNTNESGRVFVGELNLEWALYLPRLQQQGLELSMDALVVELIEWIGQDFLCPSSEVELTSAHDLETDCDKNDESILSRYLKEENKEGNEDTSSTIDSSTILWNTPRASTRIERLEGEGVQSELTYTTWNVSFPVYEWGTEEGLSSTLEATLQRSLDTLIEQERLVTPWEDALLGIVGQEKSYFLQSSLPNLYAGIDTHDTQILQSLGGLIMVVHTFFLILAHYSSQKYLKKRVAKKKAQKVLMNADELDNMLLLTRSHNANLHYAPGAQPYITNLAVAMGNASSPARSRSASQKSLSSLSSGNKVPVSCPSYIGDNLLQPMNSNEEIEDEISEDGTEIILSSVTSTKSKRSFFSSKSKKSDEDETGSILSALSLCSITKSDTPNLINDPVIRLDDANELLNPTPLRTHIAATSSPMDRYTSIATATGGPLDPIPLYTVMTASSVSTLGAVSTASGPLDPIMTPSSAFTLEAASASRETNHDNHSTTSSSTSEKRKVRTLLNNLNTVLGDENTLDSESEDGIFLA